MTLAQIQLALGGIGLGELAPFFTNFGATELTAALATLTLASLTSLDGVTLGSLPANYQNLPDVTLAQLGAALATFTPRRPHRKRDQPEHGLDGSPVPKCSATSRPSRSATSRPTR